MQVMRLAVEEADLQAGEISCLEMHGTGTPLGDPIEVGAAAAVFGEPGWSGRHASGEPRQALCLGAVKSALGHTEPAAGATAICRTLFRRVARSPDMAPHAQTPTTSIIHSTACQVCSCPHLWLTVKCSL